MEIRSRRALIASVALAIMCGVGVAIVKGDGSGPYAMALGNISAPWLFPSLLAGYALRNRVLAACLGTVMTWLMLAAFYATYEAQGLVGQAIYADIRRYFLFGLVAGFVCGVAASAVARPNWLLATASVLLFCEGWAWTHTPAALAQRFNLPTFGAEGASRHFQSWQTVFWWERVAAVVLLVALVGASRRSSRLG